VAHLDMECCPLINCLGWADLGKKRKSRKTPYFRASDCLRDGMRNSSY
jgi:hypothetical protein